MEQNFKSQDREKILAYLENKESVRVEDLLTACGAEKLRVYPLLFELSQEKRIQIVKETELGAPEIVALTK